MYRSKGWRTQGKRTGAPVPLHAGKLDCEYRPAAVAIGGGDLPPMGLDQLSGDRQPEPAPAATAVASSICAIEAFEDIGERLGWYPLAAIGDFDDRRVIESGALQSESDLAPGRRVTDGVPQQVAEHLLDPPRIDIRRDLAVRNLQLELNPGLLGLGAIA